MVAGFVSGVRNCSAQSTLLCCVVADQSCQRNLRILFTVRCRRAAPRRARSSSRCGRLR
ncbi:hypothetical protein J6590_098001, partial [Homalodisca vitripennis]